MHLICVLSSLIQNNYTKLTPYWSYGADIDRYFPSYDKYEILPHSGPVCMCGSSYSKEAHSKS